MRISSPWRKPDTGIYYLNRAVPERLQAELGKRFIRKSLGTRDLVEAKRLILDAHLGSQREFDAAEARLAARAAEDEITAERAALVVGRFIAAGTKQNDRYARWPSLSLTFWLEQAAWNIFRTPPGLCPIGSEEDPEGLVGLRGCRLIGAGWLETVREQPRSRWIDASEAVLAPLFETADPPIARTPANAFALMDAWNAHVVEDNARLRAAVDDPFRPGSRPRLRPDLRFPELLGLWENKRSPRPQSHAEAERAVLDLVDFVGDIPVAALTSDGLMDYRDAASRLPVSMPRADRALSFRARIEKHGGTKGPRVAAVTLKKRVGAIQTLLGFAHQERWIADNVGAGVKVDGASRTTRNRRSFRHDELRALFASDLFLRPDLLLRRQTSVSDVTLYWLFLLGLTSGARIEEVGQARVGDVSIDGGVIYIDIDDVASQEPQGSKVPDKSLKNENSRRIVPVHDRVLQLGFLRYVETLRVLGQSMLFPDLSANRFGKVTQQASRRANRLIDRAVGTDARLVFHSLRHRFKDEGREAAVQERILDQLCGHAPSSVGGRYGDGATLFPLKRSLDLLTFESVDWIAIQRSAKLVDWRAAADEIVRRAASRGDTSLRIAA